LVFVLRIAAIWKGFTAEKVYMEEQRPQNGPKTNSTTLKAIKSCHWQKWCRLTLHFIFRLVKLADRWVGFNSYVALWYLHLHHQKTLVRFFFLPLSFLSTEKCLNGRHVNKNSKRNVWTFCYG
jgi:hypothetical protein